MGVIISLTILVALITLIDFGQSALRVLIACWFLLVIPGMAFVRILRYKDSFTRWTLAIGLSLALDALVAGSMVYADAGSWSHQRGVLILIGFSLLGLVLHPFIPEG